ncbi:heat shock factor protein 3-like isoform X2 [Prinia subflava]|uniref:heat shock factor protein 3-like isoform X2 n=1 Tax=Prinia subflava TaxID=208062 RepID=UPI002FE3AE7D
MRAVTSRGRALPREHKSHARGRWGEGWGLVALANQRVLREAASSPAALRGLVPARVARRVPKMREVPALPRGPAVPVPVPVPGFLAKLWALLEDPDSDDVICWSRNGENFCILDEQRFAKELLPKYFKHNNISSFIRQLNMYGFRKVIAPENGIITAEKSSVIEFQHPFFKQGKAHLLENIKRKVSAVRTEDLKVCTEDLHKVLSEVQEMREQQNNMDVRLANMKRENKALWKEVAVLRQKHSQQQKLLSKILQFILSLMQGNYIVGVKRKRSLTDAAGASPSKYSHQYVRIPVESGQTMAFSEHSADEEDGNGTGLIIRDITDTLENATNGLLAVAHTSGRAREPQAALDPGLPLCQVSQPSELNCAEPVPSVPINDVSKSGKIGTAAVELHTAQPNAPEDPVSVIDSILNESSSGNQNDPLLDREEIQDFLNCIDVSLEELQAMLSGKQYNFGAEAFSDTFNPELSALDMSLMETPPGIENMANLAESTECLGASEREIAGSKVLSQLCKASPAQQDTRQTDWIRGSRTFCTVFLVQPPSTTYFYLQNFPNTYYLC